MKRRSFLRGIAGLFGMGSAGVVAAPVVLPRKAAETLEVVRYQTEAEMRARIAAIEAAREAEGNAAFEAGFASAEEDSRLRGSGLKPYWRRPIWRCEKDGRGVVAELVDDGAHDWWARK